jgi:UDPglucose--hexose-1-phosphate uridylyltransferase
MAEVRQSGFELGAQAHRRFNPLSGEYVLVSPHRTERPWQGQIEPTPAETSVTFDPNCYLCPGNARAGGARNPQYKSTFAFDNDFAALRPNTPPGEWREGELLLAETESGRCRVICFSPRHDLTLARMTISEIKVVVDMWCEEFSQLAADPNVRSVQIFENRGALMGSSNPHPHGQIWANESVPDELAREVVSQRAYFQKHNASLLEEYLRLELEKQERLVCTNEHFVAMVPFWAIWPFETLLISRRRLNCLPELQGVEREGLADILRQLMIRYDNLFKASFPYSMGFHQAPTDGNSYPGFHLHAHFYPPLLRSATVKKFMVGYELLAMPQRDITAELAAKHLRDLPAVHYLDE